jgi:hypothetical protein
MERTIPSGAQRPRLLDQVRDAMRRKHYNLRTEASYPTCLTRAGAV